MACFNKLQNTFTESNSNGQYHILLSCVVFLVSKSNSAKYFCTINCIIRYDDSFQDVLRAGSSFLHLTNFDYLVSKDYSVNRVLFNLWIFHKNNGITTYRYRGGYFSSNKMSNSSIFHAYVHGIFCNCVSNGYPRLVHKITYLIVTKHISSKCTCMCGYVH